MTESPILFSVPMVRAILAGRKTQTRRPVKPQPVYGDVMGTFASWMFQKRGGKTGDHWLYPNAREQILAECPYGVPGGNLWIKETFLAYGRWETRFNEKKGRDEWHFIDMTLECDRAYQYVADDANVQLAENRGGVLPGWWRRPSIFMPRAASRITLEVTDMRIERLDAISERDARAEGVTIEERHMVGYCIGAYLPPSIRAYRELWDSLNAERGFEWQTDPWVWVVEFKRS
jgi:hypothetical protein